MFLSPISRSKQEIAFDSLANPKQKETNDQPREKTRAWRFSWRRQRELGQRHQRSSWAPKGSKTKRNLAMSQARPILSSGAEGVGRFVCFFGLVLQKGSKVGCFKNLKSFSDVDAVFLLGIWSGPCWLFWRFEVVLMFGFGDVFVGAPRA